MRAAADVEEDWGAARAWGVLLLMLSSEGGVYIASAWMVGCVCEGVCARCVAMCCSSSSSERMWVWVWVWCCRVRYLAAAMLAGRAGWLLAIRLSLSRSGSLSLTQGVHSAKQNSPLG